MSRGILKFVCLQNDTKQHCYTKKDQLYSPLTIELYLALHIFVELTYWIALDEWSEKFIQSVEILDVVFSFISIICDA